jgi:lipoyl(octanoyl) transferase
MVNESLQRQIAAERFAILKKQESGVYACVEYLDSEFQRKQLQQQTYSGPNASIFDSLSNDSSTGSLNEIWREKICEWCYQVVDHFDFSREVVGISMSFLDRYLSTRRVNKKIFQLAAMTCLYLAIKLHEPGSLKISSLIALSRGFFTKSHVLAMEESILRYVLCWNEINDLVVGDSL